MEIKNSLITTYDRTNLLSLLELPSDWLLSTIIQKHKKAVSVGRTEPDNWSS